jgi:AraC family transcriptional regulator, regulatory protein of adaptative response / methylated-DNA-[protein]-cysteine methyltransferase
METSLTLVDTSTSREDENLASQRRRVEEACKYIEENLDAKLNLQELGRYAGLSPFHLQRVFKRIVGISPREYAEAARLGRLKLSLKGGESVRKSIYRSGRNSTSWLYSNPFQKLGMRPAIYKSGGAGMSISYTTTGCRLGRLLVAGTQHGICAVSIADSDRSLESRLANEYPSAEIRREDTGKLASWMERILEYLDGKEAISLSNLPLDIQATSFQYKVWKELLSIPYGSTRSYSEVAKRMSLPEATRAVANACAANPVPLVIPCHRVIRKNGDLGGYGLGVGRKKSLLKKEKELGQQRLLAMKTEPV